MKKDIKKKSPWGLRLFIAFLASIPAMGIIGDLFDGCGKASEYPKSAMTATNLKAALNANNKARMKKFGIKLPSNITSIGSSALFPNEEYTDSYANFESRAIAMLQPAEVACAGATEDCHTVQVRGVSTILSLSAIGVYQILLWHHGKVLDGWDDPTADGKTWAQIDWAKNLHVIYEYMNDMKLQNKAFEGLIIKLLAEHKGDPKQMASAYYSGSGARWWDIGDYLSAEFGYGSKHSYGNKVRDCFKAATGSDTVENTPAHLGAYRICISKKETGYLQNAEAQCPKPSLGILQKYGDSACFVGDSYMAGIANGKGKKKVWSLKGKSFVPDVSEKAKEVLEDEGCKLLVLNGGLNDMYGSSVEEIRARAPQIKSAYEAVIQLARKKGVEMIVVYDVPLIAKSPCKKGDCTDKKQAILDSTGEVNEFLEDDLGADEVIHTNDFIVGDDATKWTKDGIHPKSYACLKNRL